MYPWYRDTQIGVGQFCGPVSATIKTESGFNDCMLTFDYATSTGSHNKVSIFHFILPFKIPFIRCPVMFWFQVKCITNDQIPRKSIEIQVNLTFRIGNI